MLADADDTMRYGAVVDGVVVEETGTNVVDVVEFEEEFLTLPLQLDFPFPCSLVL